MVRKIRGILLLLMILGLISMIMFAYQYFSVERIDSGVYFKDIHLGGRSEKGVEELLNTASFTFVGPEGKIISIPLREMGITLDYRQIFQTGCQISPPQSWFRNLFFRLISREKVCVPFQYHIDRKLWSQSINALAEHWSTKPRDAYFKVEDNNQVEIIPEKCGYHLNSESLQQTILENLGQTDSPLELRIPAEKVPPQISASGLRDKGVENFMTSFTTSFDITLTNRVDNIELAAKTLNNHLLAPGEVFSLSRVFGGITAKQGYKKAPVIVGGELVPGIGGGVCQISSTLYNAALLADLEILERHQHQLTVPYIDPGRDATYSFPSKDLTFRNNKGHYILITADVKGDKLTIRLFGRPLKERVEIHIKVLETYPAPEKDKLESELKPGEIVKGYPGYLVEVWKTVYRGEKKVKEEKISEDRYLPFLKKETSHQ